MIVIKNESIRIIIKTFCLLIIKNPVWVLLRVTEYMYSTVASLVPAYILKRIIDLLTDGQNIQKCLKPILLLAAFGFFQELVSLCFAHFDAVIHAKVTNKIYCDLSNAIMRMSYERLEQPETQAFLVMAKNGQSGMFSVIDKLFSLLSSLVHFVVYFSIITSVQMPLVFIILLCVTVRSCLKAVRTKIQRKHRVSYSKTLFTSNVFSRLLKNMEYGKEVRLLNLADWLTEKCKASQKERNKESEKISSTNLLFHWFNDIVIRAETVASYVFIGWKALTEQISIGDFFFYFSCINQFSGAISKIGDELTALIDSVDLMKEYNICMTDDENLKRTETKKIKCGKSFCLEFVNVSFHYPASNVNILSNVSFSIKDKERVSFVGENGAGKTTIIKLICRLYQPTEGHILLNGKDVNAYDLFDYYDKIGAVFQDFKTYAFSVSENITLGKHIPDFNTLCKTVGIFEKIKALPDKENTFMSKEFDANGVDFSGGERQKIALARMLGKSPSLIILDEPTASLDPIAESEMFHSIRSISEKRTTVIVSHHLASSLFVDKIIVIDHGKVIEEGNHKQLMDKNGKYREMFLLQAAKYNT